MHNSIYLLQEREFINSNKNIYKIGRTKQANIQRFNQYPKGSKLLLHIICDDCDILETELIRDFKNKYIHRKDIGNEYFEGDYKEMIKDIYNKITNCENIEDLNIKNNDYSKLCYKDIDDFISDFEEKTKDAWKLFVRDLESFHEQSNGEDSEEDEKEENLSSAASQYDNYSLKHDGFKLFSPWFQAISAFATKKGLVVVRMRSFIKTIKDSAEQTRLFNDIKSCFSKCMVDDDTIKAMLTPDSQFYSTHSSNEFGGAFVNCFALLHPKKRRIKAVVWCQNWENTMESSIFQIVNNRELSEPFCISSSEELEYSKQCLKQSLYIRAFGFNEKNGETSLDANEYLRLLTLLKLLAIAESAHFPFCSIISIIPKKLNGNPDFVAMANDMQMLGLQRAVSATGEGKFCNMDMNDEDLLKSLSKTELTSLSVFNVLHSIHGPFITKLHHAKTMNGATVALDNASKFIDVKFHGNSSLLQEWNSLSDSYEELHPKLKIFFMARVFPTPPQLFGSYVLITSIEKLFCVSDELITNGTKGIEGGSMFSTKREVKCFTRTSGGGEDDDGILTYIENQAKKLTSDHVWNKSLREMKEKLLQGGEK